MPRSCISFHIVLTNEHTTKKIEKQVHRFQLVVSYIKALWYEININIEGMDISFHTIHNHDVTDCLDLSHAQP